MRLQAARSSPTHPDIDGLICYNDLNAVGALQTCEALNIGVPQDLSIIGFDGISLAELVRPQLSTLHVDKYSIGQLSMRMLLDRIDGKFIQHQHRHSSGADIAWLDIQGMIPKVQNRPRSCLMKQIGREAP